MPVLSVLFIFKIADVEQFSCGVNTQVGITTFFVKSLAADIVLMGSKNNGALSMLPGIGFRKGHKPRTQVHTLGILPQGNT